MAALVCMLLVFLMVGGSDAAWCVCKPDQASTALQKSLDYACGAGADCNPIIQNGVCYNPNTVLAHCSYAANSYFQRKGETPQACDFSGTAMITTTDPSLAGSGCTFPATPSAAGTSSTPNTPGGSSTTPGSIFTPSTGTGAGTGAGIVGPGPTGTTSFDGSDGGYLPMANMSSLLLTFSMLFMVLMRT